MAGNNELTAVGKLCIETLKQYPKASKNSLARKLFQENPLLFTSKEHARGMLTYHNGTRAGWKKKKNPVKTESIFTRENPYGLPETDESDYTPYILPIVNNNIGLLYDIHSPYHNIPALNCAIKFLKEQKINTLIIAGDGMDCHHGSKFLPDPTKRDLRGELVAMREMLSTFKRIFPKVKIFYLEGNHEVRWQNYIRTHAPQLALMEEFELPVILQLRPMGIEWINRKRIIKAGKLNIVHGHEFAGGGSGGVNPARGLYLKAKKSTIEGHFHQVSEHTEPSPTDGELTTCWSVGCLCELHPDYMPLNKWSHGFAHVRVEKDGMFSVKNMRIKNGKIL